MQHLIGLIATQLPFACAALALHGHFVGGYVTFLAFGWAGKRPRNSRKI